MPCLPERQRSSYLLTKMSVFHDGIVSGLVYASRSNIEVVNDGLKSRGCSQGSCTSSEVLGRV